MKNQVWEEKLLGKTLVVDITQSSLSSNQARQITLTFKIADLPEGHRVLPPGAIQTRDWRPERLNVFVDEGYKVERVYFG